MKILYLLCFLTLSLFAQGEVSVFSDQSRKIDALPEIEKRIYQNIAPSDENGDFEREIRDPFVSQSALVLTSDELPSSVYVGEVFPLTIYAKTYENTNFDFKIFVDKNDDLIFLNPNAKWIKQDDSYQATLWFEAKTLNANLERIIVKLTRNDEPFQEAVFTPSPIRFKASLSDKNFSHLVAGSLQIKKVKTSHFDENNLIMMMELNATNTNLRSFHMNGISRQGIENLKGDFNASEAFYYAILPQSAKDFEFSYFNKNNNKLENFSFKLQISDDEVSTQSDLSPISKDFTLYKQYALWVLCFIFVVIFVLKRSYIILTLAFICFVTSFLFVENVKNATLKARSSVKILPTESSTYFYTNDLEERVEILGKRKDYIKILLQNGQTGWINANDLQED